MSHYHLPNRGLPQEVLEEIFRYAVPDITVIPKGDIDPFDFDQKFSGEEFHDGAYKILFNQSDAYGLLCIDHAHHEVNKRILFHESVVYIPTFFPPHWMKPLLRSLPPINHVSFSTYKMQAPHVLAEMLREGTQLKSLTIRTSVADLGDILLDHVDAIKDGNLTELRFVLGNQRLPGLDEQDYLELHEEFKSQFLSRDQSKRCNDLGMEFYHQRYLPVHATESENTQQWRDVLEAYEKQIHEVYQEAGWELYMGEDRGDESNTIVAVRRAGDAGKRRTPIQLRRYPIKPGAVYNPQPSNRSLY